MCALKYYTSLTNFNSKIYKMFMSLILKPNLKEKQIYFYHKPEFKHYKKKKKKRKMNIR